MSFIVSGIVALGSLPAPFRASKLAKSHGLADAHLLQLGQGAALKLGMASLGFGEALRQGEEVGFVVGVRPSAAQPDKLQAD
jgi:hypothetical protein